MGPQLRADGTLGTRVPSSPGSAVSRWDAPMVMIVSPSGTCPACPDCPGRIQRPHTSTLSAEDNETAGEAEHTPAVVRGAYYNAVMPLRHEIWRMMKVVEHPDVEIHELQGYGHGGMAEPAHPLLLRFVKKH